MYVMSTSEQYRNVEAISCVMEQLADEGDFSVLDPGHPWVLQNKQLRARILEDRYRDVFIQDALETGHCFLDAAGQLVFRTNEPAASFVGLALEAYVVRCINDKMRLIGRRALQWCSLRSSQPHDSFVDKFFAIGTGLTKTRVKHPFFYAPQSGVDVIFLRPAKKSVTPAVTHQPLTLMGTDVAAGIQIKAVQGNEMEEIIRPMLDNKYLNVLTLLKRPDGKHTADYCMDIIRRLSVKGKITELQRRHLERGICRPEDIGFDQREIDWYREYTTACYEGRVPSDDSMLDALAIEVKNYKYSEAGVLFPGSELS